jgi:MoxR-like ATPase
MMRMRIGYPPPAGRDAAALGGRSDRARDVPQVLDPARLVALQREVERVELDNGARHVHAGVLTATRTTPTLSSAPRPAPA